MKTVNVRKQPCYINALSRSVHENIHKFRYTRTNVCGNQQSRSNQNTTVTHHEEATGKRCTVSARSRVFRRESGDPA